MFKRLAYSIAFVMLGVILGAVLQPFSYLQTFAQPGCQTFKETGKQFVAVSSITDSSMEVWPSKASHSAANSPKRTIWTTKSTPSNTLSATSSNITLSRQTPGSRCSSPS